MTSRHSSTRRAERLLRWYPRVWRERYGEEFTALLMEDLAERPRWSGRTINVMGSGLLARLTAAGLTGSALEEADQARATLATLLCSVAAFMVLGVSMWSQLTIGWQWSAPTTTGTTVAIVTMTLAVAIFIALALCAVGPVLWTVARSFAAGDARNLARPLVLVATGIALVIVGSRHFGNGWPGTGGHPWAHQGLVPGGVAAFSWASTLSITSYWVHPAALLAFPAPELAWMLASPVALVMVAIGSAKVVRRVHLSLAALRVEILLGRLAVATMAVFLLAAGEWILRGGTGPRGLFDAGSIDRLAIVAMTASLVLAKHSLGRARTRGSAPWAT